MYIFFLPIYNFFKERKLLFWIVFLTSFAFWVFLASRIQLKEDISSMLPDSDAIQTMNSAVSNTEAGEQVIFLMSFADNTYRDADSLTYAADDFYLRFNEELDEYIDTILLQPGSNIEEGLLEVVENNLPLFLEKDDYARIDSLTQTAQIDRTLAANKRVLLSPASVVYKKLVANDPLGISNIVWERLQKLNNPEYELHNGYLFHKKTGKLTFFLKPKYASGETGKNSVFFSEADDLIVSWRKEHPGINITYFGAPVVAAGNASQMRDDTMLTLSITAVLLLAITFYYFKRKRTPLLLLVPVLYGGVMGVGLMYLFQGSMSIIALGAGAIVMGIAIDFSVHFLSHARKSSIRDTVKELSQPLTLGSLTTIAAFLSLRLTGTPILEDLGFFAATSLLGAALCTLVFLPHMLSNTKVDIADIKPSLFDSLARLKPEQNKWLVLLIVLVTPVMLYLSADVQFDSDLMHLNYMSDKVKQAQDEVSEVNADALSSVYVIAENENEDDAIYALESVSESITRLKKDGKIRSASIPTLLISSVSVQRDKIKKWKDYWTQEKQNTVLGSIQAAAQSQGYSASAFNGFSERINSTYKPFDSTTLSFLKSLFPTGFSKQGDRYYALATLKVPSKYREDVFSSLSNEKDVIVTDKQEGATQLVGILKSNFTDIAIYSSLIVFLALLIGYGRIELAIMSFLPMAISWVWILGLMSLLGLKFNIVNVIISSLVFGLGDDYAIFTMEGLVEKYRTGKQKLTSVRAAVYVSVATAIIGLGVLLLAKHPALRSIAFISVVGLLCVLFISQTLQPFLFNLFIQKRADKRFLPFTLRSFLLSVFAFTYFFIGSIILTILGVIFTKLWPFNKERGKYYFHVWISRYTRSMMYIMINLKKRVFNLSNEKYDQPAVFIANHSSFLDILIMTMLHPKLVLLTNRWVWRSPVFGAVVRMGEYYPVADGAEESIEPLRDLVNRGYSIVVFPEGTRSTSDKIHRFHKGAFYIAEKLRLDIVPVLLHGVHYNMQKGDWLLKDGTCSIYLHKRISPDDNTYGDSYSKRAKHIGKWMRGELESVKVQNETPKYFKEQLQRSYTYKGPVLEWYCRIKTMLEGYYEQFHDLLPRKGTFYDLGCGYGFMTYMLHWSAPERKFTGIDYDTGKIETAQNSFLRDDDISFEQGDLTEAELEECDGILICDVLHYLLPEQQVALLEKSVSVLNSGGKLIIRDGVSELKDRIKGTKITEVFSTKIFRFNKTQNELHFISRKLIEDFALKYNMNVVVIDNEKRTANLIFVLTKP